MNNDGGLMKNPWSWTKQANVFVIESPVGVGYSYCAKQLEGEVCQNTDKFTASTARAALQDFFNAKFPEFASNDFFITGESYAGVYIPTLSKEILDKAPEINLVGVAVGDPCTDNTAQMDSMEYVLCRLCQKIKLNVRARSNVDSCCIQLTLVRSQIRFSRRCSVRPKRSRRQ